MKNELTIVTNQQSPAQPRWQFDHHRLDAYHVAMQALVKGTAIINSLPRGYGKLKDQAARALQGAFTQTTEASARTGADRLARYRSARAEAGEVAGLFEAFEKLGLADPGEVDEVLELLWRLSAMLCRLAKLKR
jgi:four helix bundle protein